MTRRAYLLTAVTATLAVPVLAAEQAAPGFTFLALDVIAEAGRRLAAAAVWPLAAIALVWIGYRFGRIDGTRDAEQRIARTRPSQRTHLSAVPKDHA